MSIRLKDDIVHQRGKNKEYPAGFCRRARCLAGVYRQLPGQYRRFRPWKWCAGAWPGGVPFEAEAITIWRYHSQTAEEAKLNLHRSGLRLLAESGRENERQLLCDHVG